MLLCQMHMYKKYINSLFRLVVFNVNSFIVCLFFMMFSVEGRRKKGPKLKLRFITYFKKNISYMKIKILM